MRYKLPSIIICTIVWNKFSLGVFSAQQPQFSSYFFFTIFIYVKKKVKEHAEELFFFFFFFWRATQVQFGRLHLPRKLLTSPAQLPLRFSGHPYHSMISPPAESLSIPESMRILTGGEGHESVVMMLWI